MKGEPGDTEFLDGKCSSIVSSALIWSLRILLSGNAAVA